MIAAFLARFAPYKLAAEIAVFGVLAAGTMVGVHNFLERERDIGRAEVRVQWDKANAAAEKVAADQTEAWRAASAAAVTEGVKRDETIRSLAANSAAAAGGLRDAVAKINSAASSDSANALRDLTRTYGDILTECEGRRREVGEEAERLNSEKRTLIEAWPVSTSTKD